MPPQRVSLQLYISMPICISVLKPCRLSISWPWQQQMTEDVIFLENSMTHQQEADWFGFTSSSHLRISGIFFFFSFLESASLQSETQCQPPLVENILSYSLLKKKSGGKQFHLSSDRNRPINHVISADVQFKRRWIIEVKRCIGQGVQHVKHHLFLV